MDGKDRIKMIRLLEKMNLQKEYSERLGLEDDSKFHEKMSCIKKGTKK